ncbi:hypothetical protein RF11_12805 [Thelohanellus kitauei]|uniref:Uncharacterized protein n=1 Tax=Thelohanellus kitauei TaxID=669202 RepID=A0A0C2MI99_THEKT|nr:hypothetical protein RF11_12805 [Thelohanellus kitauei]
MEIKLINNHRFRRDTLKESIEAEIRSKHGTLEKSAKLLQDSDKKKQRATERPLFSNKLNREWKNLTIQTVRFGVQALFCNYLSNNHIFLLDRIFKIAPEIFV